MTTLGSPPSDTASQRCASLNEGGRFKSCVRTDTGEINTKDNDVNQQKTGPKVRHGPRRRICHPGPAPSAAAPGSGTHGLPAHQRGGLGPLLRRPRPIRLPQALTAPHAAGPPPARRPQPRRATRPPRARARAPPPAGPSPPQAPALPLQAPGLGLAGAALAAQLLPAHGLRGSRRGLRRGRPATRGGPASPVAGSAGPGQREANGSAARTTSRSQRRRPRPRPARRAPLAAVRTCPAPRWSGGPSVKRRPRCGGGGGCLSRRAGGGEGRCACGAGGLARGTGPRALPPVPPQARRGPRPRLRPARSRGGRGGEGSAFAPSPGSEAGGLQAASAGEQGACNRPGVRGELPERRLAEGAGRRQAAGPEQSSPGRLRASATAGSGAGALPASACSAGAC